MSDTMDDIIHDIRGESNRHILEYGNCDNIVEIQLTKSVRCLIEGKTDYLEI